MPYRQLERLLDPNADGETSFQEFSNALKKVGIVLKLGQYVDLRNDK